MIDPLQILNDSMAQFRLRSGSLFEGWKDSSAEQFKRGCPDGIEEAFNIFANQMNTHIRVYMNAQHYIDNAMQEIEKVEGNL